MSKKSDKKKVPAKRNWLAVHAHMHGGAGKHKDKTKYSRSSNRNALRKEINGDLQ